MFDQEQINHFINIMNQVSLPDLDVNELLAEFVNILWVETDWLGELVFEMGLGELVEIAGEELKVLVGGNYLVGKKVGKVGQV